MLQLLLQNFHFQKPGIRLGFSSEQHKVVLCSSIAVWFTFKMFPKHFTAYTLIICLFIAIKCDQPPRLPPPLPLPHPVQIHGIIRQGAPIIHGHHQHSSHYPTSYPMLPLPSSDYEDLEAAYGHSQAAGHGQSNHGKV